MTLINTIKEIFTPPEWANDAACVGQWELFDDCQGLSNEKIMYLRGVCFNECPVRSECLKSALKIEKDEEWIWTFRGGYTPGERERILAEGWTPDLYKQF